MELHATIAGVRHSMSHSERENVPVQRGIREQVSLMIRQISKMPVRNSDNSQGM